MKRFYGQEIMKKLKAMPFFRGPQRGFTAPKAPLCSAVHASSTCLQLLLCRYSLFAYRLTRALTIGATRSGTRARVISASHGMERYIETRLACMKPNKTVLVCFPVHSVASPHQSRLFPFFAQTAALLAASLRFVGGPTHDPK